MAQPCLAAPGWRVRRVVDHDAAAGGVEIDVVPEYLNAGAVAGPGDRQGLPRRTDLALLDHEAGASLR